MLQKKDFMYRIARNVGIELECSANKRYTYSRTSHWQSGYDGSVASVGNEFRFSQPYNGQDVIDAVNNITGWMTENKFRVHGVGAGFHLHLDYRGKDLSLARNLVDIADSIYPYLSTKFSNQRKMSGFCYMTHYRDCYVSYNNRYRWIHTYNMSGPRKTVEVRLHHGTKTASKILTWCEFWSEFSLQCDAGRISRIKNKSAYNDMLRNLNVSQRTKSRFLC